MSAPTPQTDPPTQPPPEARKRPDWLPSRTALLVVAGAFAAGLLLFLALWLDQRSDNDFYKADGVPRSVEGQAFEPLPAPLPAGEDAQVAEGDWEPGEAPPPTAGQPTASAAPPPLAPVAPPPGEVAPPPAMADASLPRPVDAPAPDYPRTAQRRRQQGTVVLRVQVDARGNPRGIDIIERSGSRSLDRAAVDAVRRWHFAPAVRNGQPVAGTVDVPIEFTLQR